MILSVPATSLAAGSYACPNMPAGNPSPPAAYAPSGTVNFESGSIIIPMDNCYQRNDKASTETVELAVDETFGSSASIASQKCDSSAGDTGVILAYALVHRLIESGIPVYWSIKGSKTAWADWDLKVTKGGGSPVLKMARNGTTSAAYSTLSEMRYAGGPFIIDASHAAAAKTLINGYGSTYDEVDFHLAQINFSAPIYKTLGEMPKLAVLDLSAVTSQDKFGFMQGTIGDAQMNPLEGTWWTTLTHTDVLANKLISGDYDIAWVHSFQSISSAAVVAKLEAFVAAGGSIMFQDESIHALEGYGSFNTSTGVFTSSAAAAVSSSFAHSNGGLVYDFYSSAYGNNSTDEWTRSGDYSDPASQWGGAAWTGIGGSKFDWTGRCDLGYRNGVRRMVYTDNHGSGADNVEFAAWKHYNNSTSAGRVYYIGGYNWRKNTSSGMRLVLNTLFVSARAYQSTSTVEVSRSAPIIATVGSDPTAQYQGTTVVAVPATTATTFTGAASAATFVFPHNQGHLRAFALSDVSSDGTAFDEVPEQFDANARIPAANLAGCSHFTSGCRTVFTHVGSPTNGLVSKPTRVYLQTSTAATLKPYLDYAGALTSTETETLVSRILAGVKNSSGTYEPRLGGINRSTMAIIEPSPFISPSSGSNARPTMIYVGATDGMLHALCGEVKGACTMVGRELWAYIPRTELGLLRFNTQVIDGSPKVADVFFDHDGDGRRSWRTVLTFQSGTGTSSVATIAPSVTALDITSPDDPTILWERTTPATRGTIEQGVGLNLAMGPVRLSGQTRNLTFAQTNNGGTGSAGFWLGAIDTENGAIVWEVEHTYPNARTESNINVPASGIPGGIAAFDLESSSQVTHVAVPSLYGDLWIYQADGTNPFGTSAAFRFSADFQPIGASPTIYLDQASGRTAVAFASGSYADPVAAVWTANIASYLVAIVADPSGGSLPLSESGSPTDRKILVSLGAGQHALSQAVVAGDELFVTTDSTDTNGTSFGTTTATGQLHRIDLTSRERKGTAVTVTGGGSAVDVTSSGAVLIGSGSQAQRIDVASSGGGGAFDDQGSAIESDADDSSVRVLWVSG